MANTLLCCAWIVTEFVPHALWAAMLLMPAFVLLDMLLHSRRNTRTEPEAE